MVEGGDSTHGMLILRTKEKFEMVETFRRDFDYRVPSIAVDECVLHVVLRCWPGSLDVCPVKMLACLDPYHES